MKLRHLDLFSGIGGFSLGLEATGAFETIAFCDIEKYCLEVLEKRFPSVPRYTDLRELNYERLRADGIISDTKKIDIITGGYPCQPFSVAGRKKGEEDPRHLWPEYFRLVKELRPTWVIGENVSGHIKLGLDTVIQNLEDEGYAVRPFSISASSVGANHQRERIWIVAHAKHNSDQQQVPRSNGEEKTVSEKYWEEHGQSWKPSRTNSIRQQDNGHENVVNTDNFRSSQHTEATEETSRRRTETSFISTSDVEDTRQHSRGIEPSRDQESIRPGSPEKTEWAADADKTSGSSEGGEITSTTSEVANSDSQRGRSWEANRQDAEDVREPSRRPWDGWWDIEPNVGRVAHGVSKRVDRLKSLGNSLVPSIPYYIGLSIIQSYMANTDGEKSFDSETSRDDG